MPSMIALCGLGLAAVAVAAPRINITEINVTPAEVARGESFTLRVSAESDGVEIGSFRLRTPYETEAIPPGFAEEAGRAVYQDDAGAIRDNGPVDLEPADGEIAIEVSTENLPIGVNYLVVFAHNRPAPGPHILDYRNLRLDVSEDTVSIRAMDRGVTEETGGIEFMLPDSRVEAGEPLVCGAKLTGEGSLALRLRPPYTWGEDEVLPGFVYYPEEKTAYVEDDAEHLIADGGPNDLDPADRSLRLEVPTDGWGPGVHVLTLEAPVSEGRHPYGRAGGIYRDFAIKVPGPNDHLDVVVEPSSLFGEGTHFGSLVSLGNGRVVTDSHVSEDAGRTWRELPGALPRPSLLRDGSLLAMAYRALPVEGQKGVYAGFRHASMDGGETVEGPSESQVLVPKARAALGHGPHVGPLFGRSIVELENGDLVAGMYGWFDGDVEPDRYRKGGTMRRAYTCISQDRGETWEYLSTVAYEPFLGNEGYSELVIRGLPNGEILALVRTGGNSNPGWQDNPLMTSRSADGGRTWSPVERTGVEGCWPDLCVMDDGTLACTTGRPGAFIMFSADNGRTWTDHTPLNGERYSGYTAVCEVAPGELLVGYGARARLDPETGERRDSLRLCRVRVGERPVAAEGGGDSAVASVRIVGLLPNPRGVDTGHEVVMLKNLGQVELSLEGWRLRDRAGHAYALSGSIDAGAALRIAMGTFVMPLNNDGDEISLFDGAARSWTR